ncbi:MAG: glycine--tRNA ligase subunit beta [Acidobacteriota bacterium]|nr:glycine--tRNA ligase subunit beta [Acidobacteriota bacterium]
MNKFLFELGLEEIPAEMTVKALEQMCGSCERLLEESQISFESLQKYASPRRLVFRLEGLPDGQSEREEVVLGPSESVAYDQEKKPTKALEGFARKGGVAVGDIEVVDTAKGNYVSYRETIPGRPLEEIFQEILPRILTSISWPKNMYWKESRFRFIRPLRWYLALFNDEILPFEFEGIQADNITRGHRFLGEERIQISDSDHYLDRLRENYVLVDPKERKAKIAGEIERFVPDQLRVLPDPGLVEMVVHLNEYPTVICGGFDQEFLKLPQEVLVTVMRHHQKYFSVIDDRDEIQPYFLTVVNTQGDPDGKISQGHEKVLKARLEDAAFFWKTDRKEALKDRVEQLKQVVFQEKLGSYHAKTVRIRKLCAELEKEEHLDTAALLCKGDLTTDMVRELPELQGIMGGLYARDEGYPEAVCRAIGEHYKPVSLEDESPATRFGALLSVADRLDTIVGCFSIGIVPTGSSDPFALRRHAQGLIKILFDLKLNWSLRWLVEKAQKNFPEELEGQEITGTLMEFLEKRVRHIFQEKKIAYDVLNAVFAVDLQSVDDAFKRAQALAEIKDQPDFEALAIAYKRTKNILASQSIDLPEVDQDNLADPEEHALFNAYVKIRPSVEHNVQEGNYDIALREIAGLRETVDSFFDKVLVMTDDEGLKNNRLRLLHDISQLCLSIADISEVVREKDDHYE